MLRWVLSFSEYVDANFALFATRENWETALNERVKVDLIFFSLLYYVMVRKGLRIAKKEDISEIYGAEPYPTRVLHSTLVRNRPSQIAHLILLRYGHGPALYCTVNVNFVCP